MSLATIKELSEIVKASSGTLVRPFITIATVCLFVYLAIMSKLSGDFVAGMIAFVIKAWWDSRDKEKSDETLIRAALATPNKPNGG